MSSSLASTLYAPEQHSLITERTGVTLEILLASHHHAFSISFWETNWEAGGKSRILSLAGGWDSEKGGGVPLNSENWEACLPLWLTKGMGTAPHSAVQMGCFHFSFESLLGGAWLQFLCLFSSSTSTAEPAPTQPCCIVLPCVIELLLSFTSPEQPSKLCSCLTAIPQENKKRAC